MIDSPIYAASIGALLGALGTLLVEMGLRRYSRVKQVRRLRSAFLAELASMDHLLPKASDHSPGSASVGFTLPTQVYSANADRISLLTEEETDPLVRVYTGARLLERHSEQMLQILTAEGDVDPNKDMKEELGSTENIRKEWKRAVVAILKNSHEKPIHIRYNDRDIEAEQDTDMTDLWILLNCEDLKNKGSDIEIIRRS